MEKFKVKLSGEFYLSVEVEAENADEAYIKVCDSLPTDPFDFDIDKKSVELISE